MDTGANARLSAGDVWRIVKPYWVSSERWVGFGLVALIAAHVALDAMAASALANVTKEFFDALQSKDRAAFSRAAWQSLFVTLFVAFVFAAGRLLRAVVAFQWRKFLTFHYSERWFEGNRIFHIERKKLSDNPDQRVSEDTVLFTTAVLDLCMSFLGVVTQLVVYSVILWDVKLPASSGLQDTAGAAVMAALAMGAGYSLIVQIVCRKLPRILAEQQHLEADFRFALMQQRVDSEQIAFLKGQDFEKSRLRALFKPVSRNWLVGLMKGLQVEGLSNAYGFGGTLIATLVLAPSVLSGSMSMGELMQAQLAFSQVALTMSWLGDNFFQISEWLAAGRRLAGLNNVLTRDEKAGIVVSHEGEHCVRASGLTVGRPDGGSLFRIEQFSVCRGERWLITGRSGIGKSTFLRVLAGIWPEGSGTVSLPVGAKIMFTPQRPYIPAGTLKEALCYPNAVASSTDEACIESLVSCGLGELTDDLHVSRDWGRVLSLGEQQTLLFARAALSSPDFLFMDEATSALDEASESRCYEWLIQQLPGLALVSVAHRESVARFHVNEIRLEDGGVQISTPRSEPSPTVA